MPGQVGIRAAQVRAERLQIHSRNGNAVREDGAGCASRIPADGALSKAHRQRRVSAAIAVPAPDATRAATGERIRGAHRKGRAQRRWERCSTSEARQELASGNHGAAFGDCTMVKAGGWGHVEGLPARG